VRPRSSVAQTPPLCLYPIAGRPLTRTAFQAKAHAAADPLASFALTRQVQPTGNSKLNHLWVFATRKFNGKVMGFVTTKSINTPQHYYLFCIPNSTMAGF
jgi:hypothetical protein